MTIKPVADLYLIKYEDGRLYKCTRDAEEAVDAIGFGFEVEEFVSLDNHRAAMLQGAEPVSQPCTLPDGYCVMPLKLTSENGAKGALSGEFHVTNRIVCQSCAGEGCEDCNDEGGWDAEIPVSWDTIKRIHEAAVEACSLPAAPQQEVTQELAKGMERYGDAMQDLAKKEVK